LRFFFCPAFLDGGLCSCYSCIDFETEECKTLKRILNFGSLNTDYVYKVDHILQGGETIQSESRTVFPGGKGLNQSIALVRAGLSTSDQGQAIEYLYGSMINVTPVNLYDTLKSHRDEYLYFRTDHHWTALGAYYGYEQFAKAKGVEPVSLDRYTTKEFPDFLGAFYSDTGKSPALAQNPDTVVAYEPFNNTTMTFTDRNGKETPWQVITDVSGWASSSKYNTFIGGDNPYTHIVNNDLSDGSSCVVIKESFGNALIPFLIPHYQDIHVIDYRYYKQSIVDFCKNNQIQDVLFINNISATRSESLVGKMDALIP